MAKSSAGGYSGVTMSARPIQLDIFRTSIPMRGFEHAAAARNVAEAIVLRLQHDDGLVGWGETLPRDYVTGETLETVPADIEKLWQQCLTDGLLDWPARDQQKIPAQLDGRCVNAAACALELASIGGWLNERKDLLKKISARVSGVLGSISPDRTAKRLRLMRLFGLRDFKLKLGLGDDIDRENLQLVHGKLKRGLASGKFSLRVDINGGWDTDTTPDRVAELRQYGVCVVEQPVFCPADELVDLAQKCPLPLMADESVLTKEDAKILLRLSAETGGRKKIWWNIRLSKNGGLLRTLELMNLAAENNVPISLGCMVGESSILSAVQRRALQLGPTPRFVEGNYGKFLLADDLAERNQSLRFGYGGRLRTLPAGGLGIAISEDKVKKYSQHLKTLMA